MEEKNIGMEKSQTRLTSVHAPDVTTPQSILLTYSMSVLQLRS